MSTRALHLRRRRALRRQAVAFVAALGLLLAGAGPARAGTEVIGFNEDAVDGLHGVTPDQYAGLVRAAGGNVIRTNLDWRNAEPEEGVWNERWWDRWAELYNESLARGVRPIFIVGFAPKWAAPKDVRCSGFGGCELPPRPEMDVAWANYTAEVARRFPKAMIEVWNEPNTADFWRPRPDPQRFAELLTLAYHSIKAVSPRTEVVMGGLLNVRRKDAVNREVSVEEFLSVAYSVTPSIKGHADYIGLHPYPRRARLGPRSRFARGFREMRAVMAAAGDSTPMLVTEVGVSTADLRRFPQRRQSKAMTRIHRKIDAMDDVAGVVYHRLVEPLDTTDDPREHGYAWLRYGDSPLEPRRVYCRFVKRAGRSYDGC